MEDWKEKAFQAFIIRQAEEEAAWQRKNPTKVKFWLSFASDEPQTFSVGGQNSLQELITSLKDNNIEVDAPGMALDAADAVGGYIGEIAVLATAISPLLTGILGAWLQSKTGRKIRIKDGDIEVEGQTLEQVEKGFEIIAEQRAKRKQEEDR